MHDQWSSMYPGVRRKLHYVTQRMIQNDVIDAILYDTLCYVVDFATDPWMTCR